MAGIYIHFPFCKQACHYCNFHFSTNGQFTEAYLKAVNKELISRREYLKDSVKTIYIGGGTPSLIKTEALEELFTNLSREYNIAEEAEVTLEANPDDLNTFRNEHLQNLRKSKVNRLSIGIQSFQDADLKFMNRVHTGKEAIAAVKHAQDAGFDNISADLMYGTPTLTDQGWLDNLNKLIDLDIPHISAYDLTVEKDTALYQFIKKGKVEPIDDHKVADQFEMMVEILEANGFEQYEIASFGKPGYHSQHNTNYWKGVPYLGLGPSAHSYNGTDRQWNIANTPQYIKGMEADKPLYEIEKLTKNDRYNEYVMTSLRTMWGVDSEHIKSHYGKEFLDHFQANVQEQLAEMIDQKDSIFTLTPKGKLYADRIASNLFMV